MKQSNRHTVHIIEVIHAPIEKIWNIIRDFNGLPTFHPAIKASRIERGDSQSVGSIRHLTLESGYVREELLMLDDQNYALSSGVFE